MASYIILHRIELAIEYEAASAAAALDKASSFQRDHTIADMLDKTRDVYVLEPKPDE